jgi:hypothetical protein
MQNSELNWGNLPTKIIKKICSNIEPGFLVSIRQINKRWYNSLNELIFHSLENWDEKLVSELIINHSYSIKSWSSAFRNEKYTQLVIDNVKYLDSISWNNSYESIASLNNLIEKFPTVKNLSIEIGFYWDQDNEFEELLNLIKNLKNLDSLKFQTFVPPLFPLVGYMRDMSLLNLSLKSLSSELYNTWALYNNSPNLISFTLDLNRIDGDFEEPTRYTILSPNSFEFHSSLEHVNLNAYGIMYRKQLYNYYGKEILAAFESQKFKNLKSFSWTLDAVIFNDDVITLYDDSINFVPSKFPKLTLLSLELCDPRLLNMISEQFPNLVELKLNCPLPLPHPQSNRGSFNRLKKLTTCGYHRTVLQSLTDIQTMFPVLSTLKFKNTCKSNDFTSDLSKVPILFPNVKSLTCYYDNGSWHTLLNSENSYYWEVLYIPIYGDETQKVMKLLAKLPKLRILYLYNTQNDLKDNGFKFSGNVCVVCVSDNSRNNRDNVIFEILN